MKKYILRTIIVAATIASIGCLPVAEVEPSTTTYDVEEILTNPNLTPEQKAEQLALIGEALFTPAGFMYSNEVLDLALSQDKSNRRAQLYKRVVSPLMELKGIVRRTEPLARQFSPAVQEGFSSLKTKIAVNPAIHEFFTTGPADIRNEAQAQKFLDGVRTSQNELRLHLRNNKSMSLKLNPMVPAVRDLVEIWAECPVSGIEKKGSYHKKYTVKNCALVQKTNVAIDTGDIEALQHIAAGMQIVTGIAASYDARGSAEFDRYQAETPGASEEQNIAFARRLSTFGRLRDASGLTMIRALGTDFYAGARWAQLNQTSLCPEGWNQEQRPGQLFANGLCVGDYPDEKVPKADAVFRVMQAALAGSTVGIMVSDQRLYVSDLAPGQQNASYHSEANLLAAFVNPLADLRSVLPTQFDRCGNSTNLGDPTVGGILPKADGQNVATQMGFLQKPCN